MEGDPHILTLDSRFPECIASSPCTSKTKTLGVRASPLNSGEKSCANVYWERYAKPEPTLSTSQARNHWCVLNALDTAFVAEIREHISFRLTET